MKTVTTAALVALALAAGPAGTASAETARFRFLLAIYADEKGGGLHLPEGVACGDRGQVVVADTGNARLLRFTLQDKVVSGGSEIRLPELPAPIRVQLNSKGDILALDGKLRRIVRVGADGQFKGVLPFDGVPAPTTVVPKAFRVDSDDRVYVLDVFSRRVLVFDAGGAFSRALALPDGTRFAADLAIDGTGSVIVLDSVGRKLYAAARDANTFSQLGGDLKDLLVSLPTSLAASRGLFFVVEASGGSIATLGQDGSFLVRQLTPGWQEGSLDHPGQVCVTEKDELLVADRDNSRIQVFALSR